MNAPTSRTIVPENIRNLNGYVPGKTIAEVQEQYRPDRISKLASNENRLGFSADVEPAVQQALRTIQDYPDPVSKRLVSKIAETNQVSESQVLVGAGSESIISILCRTFFLNKEHAITCSTTFVGFFVQIGVRGVRLKKIPPTSDFRFDVKAIVNAVDAHTKMIYIANPNNPTGTYINRSEFEWMM
ncbi:MAG: aminotransferase class I/II-fold pyridoxal phosphate-dependent enzyme, partial [Bacteroidota bacterium]